MFVVIIIAATAFIATEPGIDANLTAALSPGEDARALRRPRTKKGGLVLPAIRGNPCPQPLVVQAFVSAVVLEEACLEPLEDGPFDEVCRGTSVLRETRGLVNR